MNSKEILDRLKADVSVQVDSIGPAFLRGIESTFGLEGASMVFKCAYNGSRLVVDARVTVKALALEHRTEFADGQLGLSFVDINEPPPNA